MKKTRAASCKSLKNDKIDPPSSTTVGFAQSHWLQLTNIFGIWQVGIDWIIFTCRFSNPKKGKILRADSISSA